MCREQNGTLTVSSLYSKVSTCPRERPMMKSIVGISYKELGLP